MSAKEMDAEAASEKDPICMICEKGEHWLHPLITACGCDGDIRGIHPECLAQRCRSLDSENRSRTCSHCKQEFFSDSMHQVTAGDGIAIRLVLPDSRGISFSALPDDLLGTVADILRRCLLVRGVKDISSDYHGNLTLNPSWRKRYIGEIGIESGSTLHVTPLTTDTMAIDIFPSVMCDEGCGHILEEAASCYWLDYTKDVCPKHSFEGAIAEQTGTLYRQNGHWRQCLLSIDDATNNLGYVDVDDGSIMELEKCSYFTQQFITYENVATAAALNPHLYVYPSPAVFTFNGSGALTRATVETLYDSASAVMLTGYLCEDAGRDGDRLLLHSSGDSLIDVATARVCKDDNQAVNDLGFLPSNCLLVRIILKDGDRLPKYQLPVKPSLRYYVRHGMDVEIVDGCINIKTVDIRKKWGSRWVFKLENGEQKQSEDHAELNGYTSQPCTLEFK